MSRRHRPRRPSMMDAIMAEPVRLLGCPQIIVTRDWAYDWYRSLGYPLRGGFGSVDYMAFGFHPSNRIPPETPLTDLSLPWVARILEAIRGDAGLA